jgi:type IV secretion system protein VirB11
VQVFEGVATLFKNSPVGNCLGVTEIRRVLQTTLDVLVVMAGWKAREVFYDPIFAKWKVADRRADGARGLAVARRGQPRKGW